MKGRSFRAFTLALGLAVLMIFLTACPPGTPTVVITASSETGVVPLAVDFDVSQTEQDGVAKLLSYEFQIQDEDGNTFDRVISSEPTCSYLFENAGVYHVQVSVNDTSGGVGSGTATFTGTSPFESMSWVLTSSSVYANEGLALSAASVAIPDAVYIWQVADADGKVVFETTGAGTDFVLPELGTAGSYTVVLTVRDIYNNEGVFSAPLTVLSTDTPKAALTVLYGGVAVDGTETVYENQTVELDASASAAANSGDSFSITGCTWSILHNGVELEVLTKGTTAAFDYQLGEAGTYDFLVEVTNNVGLSNSSAAISVSANENKPVVTALVTGATLYEGVETTLALTAASAAAEKGAITRLILDFNDIPDVTLDQLTDLSAIAWTPAYDSASNADRSFPVRIYVENEAGRLSDGFSRMIAVKDNNPAPRMTLSADRLFYDKTLQINASTSASPDGALTGLDLVILNNGGQEVASHSFTDPAAPFAHTFSGTGAIGNYTAVLTARNVNGSKELRKNIEVTDKQAIASFSMTPDPAVDGIHEGQTITCDASASRDAAGSSILTYAWKLVDNSGKSVDTATGLQYNYTAPVDSTGIYKVILTVTDAAASKSDTVEKELFIALNYPVDVTVVKNDLLSDPAAAKQVLDVSGVSPDGNGLIFNWFDGVIPDGAATPHQPNNSQATFNFNDGADHIIYIEAINSIDSRFRSVISYLLKADDTTPPDVPTLSNNYIDNLTSDATPVWQWSSSADAVAYRYQMNGEVEADWMVTSAGQGEWTTALGEGVHTIYVQAADEAGNWSASTTGSFTVDLTPPAAPVVDGPALRIKDRDPLFTWEAGFYGYRHQLNGEVVADWNIVSDAVTSWPASALADGDYTLNVQSRDKAGNWSVSGSYTLAVDNAGPVITLAGDDPLQVNINGVFVEPGYTSVDASTGQNCAVTTAWSPGAINTAAVGDYVITYSSQDDLANSSFVTRTVQVRDIEKPTLALTGANPMTLVIGNPFTEPGATSNDNVDGDISGLIGVVGSVDTASCGSYILTYRSEDSSGNVSTLEREVVVIADVIQITSTLESDLTLKSDQVVLNWTPVVGSKYNVYRSNQQAGPYSLVHNTNSAAYSEDPGIGVWFYKVVGVTGTHEGAEGTVVKAAKAHAEDVIVTATRDMAVTNGLTVNWNDITGADGYVVHHEWDHTIASSAAADAAQTKAAAVFPTYPLSDVAVSELVMTGEGSSPAGPNYYYVEVYVDKDAHGWTGGGRLSMRSSGAIGYRNVTDNEWVNEVMKDIHAATAPMVWSSAPWSDYWNASSGYENGADYKGIVAGFDVDPAGVPGNLPGSLVSGPNVSIAAYNGTSGLTDVFTNNGGTAADPYANVALLKQGRAIVEHVRTKEGGADAVNNGDYTFTRWWLDSLRVRYLNLQGSKRYSDRWGLFNQAGVERRDWSTIYDGRIRMRVTVTGFYPGYLFCDDEPANTPVNCDSLYTKDAGPSMTAGSYQIKRNGAADYTVITHDSAVHFTW